MRERNLRKQALESSKTVSRKARSTVGTPTSSRANSVTPSRNGSRVPSADVSDDDGDFSDGTQWSTNSIDELLLAPPELENEEPGTWIADIGDLINEICDRKRSSVQGREEALNVFSVMMMRHYAKNEIASRMDDLLPAILKSVKAGQTEKETVLGLKALALMIVSDPSDTVYDTVSGPIKLSITDAQHPGAKIAAIHALSLATFYGGASDEEILNVMEFFLEIITTDGEAVEEADNAEIVTAALVEWSFLATLVEDVQDVTEEAMDAFVDQLESSNATVQIAAGENIALLFEKSHTEAESDDELSSEDEAEAASRNERNEPRFVKRYTVYRQQHLLEKTLEELARASSKRLSKKDRKNLHLTFKDVLLTVEKPTRGPRWSTAIDDETGREYGSRLKISVSDHGRMTIDEWWKLHRLNGLKRLLQSGFLVHYDQNPAVYESLPVEYEQMHD
ncbi:Hypothetical protein R9X50_00464500 [Acrodontium crateriforme]|uniref:Interferon-related developmental regulator N-terminal domain-containing protein n=1 Tax=Acrodontium crateriforme TaxID=150365 RepID=A0AAQ3M6G3_9PEZI|nr:Hypothetical protein R9X50_00464500 [Acrodontium crateriforme]